MKILAFLNNLGLGGTEKAACRWAQGLADRGHQVLVRVLQDGPRRSELERKRINVRVLNTSVDEIATELRADKPDVIHAHVPGQPHVGDILGEALVKLTPRIPLVQTNIFGRFENPREEQWTDFRLFISWTSCVQAARRAFKPLDKAYFRRASVAVYPVDPDDGPSIAEVETFRNTHGIRNDEVLFGRISRPEPNKWTDIPLIAFRKALRQDPRLKLLLREPPPAVAESLRAAKDRDRFIILKATAEPMELRETMGSLDAVLHTSSMGESFGYGIAEPMNYGKPVITNTTPWADQAQIELVPHAQCGFVTGTANTMAKAMLKLAQDAGMRANFGVAAKAHIRKLADPNESLDRLEGALLAVVSGQDNPCQAADLVRARAAETSLDRQQFGHTLLEQLALRPFHYRVRFHQWRKARFSKRVR